jgi:hypothetical protein
MSAGLRLSADTCASCSESGRVAGKSEAKAASQCLAAHKIASRAACAVLKRRFPEEQFIVDSHMD